MEYLIGLDIGTSSVKGVLMTSEGVTAHTAKELFIYRELPNRGVEIDAEDYLSACYKALKTLAGAAKDVLGDMDDEAFYRQIGWPFRYKTFPLAHLCYIKKHNPQLLEECAMGSWGHEPTFRTLIPHLEDGQVIHIFTDNFGCLLFRRIMREMGCTKKVIVGGWSSAPYGTRIESIGKFQFPHVGAKYRAITLRGAALPMTDTDAFLEASTYLPCMDAVTNGDGAAKANTVLDVDFANVNPVIHVPAKILKIFIYQF